MVAHGGAASDTHLSLQVVPYGEGQRLLLARDVTRQTRLEAMRKDFVANASHELRSPLTVIAGYLESIDQDSTLDPLLRAPVEEMRRQAQADDPHHPRLTRTVAPRGDRGGDDRYPGRRGGAARHAA